ncbi:MAG: (Fe-S)-binding protein, partial [Beijerinckiaceae bacterium]|nr:(Fe-S)-binding protein [Beijerinckiaceae bacterium]
MTLHPTTPSFKANARGALADRELQKALGHVQGGFIARRAAAIERMPEFEALRDSARDIKDHVLSHLDLY